MSVDFLDHLNDAQREAVVNCDGPSMVLAGAGSGKTRVLTYRVAYLLSKGVNPSSIISLTFTKKAAREMKDRITNLVGSKAATNVWMGTFHSVFSKILRIEANKIGYASDYTIYDTDDSISVVKAILKDFSIDVKEYKPNFILSRISSAKMNLINPDEYVRDSSIQSYDRELHKPLLGQIYREYWIRCRRSSAMDFDDILYNTSVLFRDNPEVLKKYQSRLKYILVDEYQDTNFAQYVILRMLAATSKNICVVGDDAQSIYAFRGADIENILNFKKDYPESSLYKLEQNYRSTQTIVNAANNVITHNKNKLEKVVWTENEEGEKISLIKSSSDVEEGMLIANAIFHAKMTYQLDNKDFAVLYRTNRQSRILEESLRKMNIKYRIYGGMSFYKRAEVKNLLAYFRLVVNPFDNEAFMRIVNYPHRGLGPTSLGKLTTLANENKLTYWETLEQIDRFPTLMSVATKFKDFYGLIKTYQLQQTSVDAFTLAQNISVGSGIVKDLFADKSPEGVARYESIESILNGVKIFQDDFVFENEDAVPSLGNFLQSVALLTDADEKDDENDDDKVSLMTIHAAKGLEFPFVFITGMEEGLFPNFMSAKDRKQLEEERRLFYVAVTRAMSRLSISYAETRYVNGELKYSEPSRFIGELSDEFVEKTQTSYSFKPKTTGSTYQFNTKNKDTNSFVPKKSEYSFQPKSAQPQTNKNVGNKQYSFVELAKVSDIVEGAKIEHSRFGIGEVVHVEGNGDDRKAIVIFDDFGEKQLVLKFAKLKLVK